MNISRTLLGLAALLVVAANLYAAEKLYPAPPAKITLYTPNKPQNVKDITASETSCDSPSTYSFMVSWKPVFKTWGLAEGQGPYIWKHYLAGTVSHCALSEIMCGDPVCTVKASGCPATSHYALIRIHTYTDETHTGKSGYSQIGGIPRPDFAWDYDLKAWKCLNK